MDDPMQQDWGNQMNKLEEAVKSMKEMADKMGQQGMGDVKEDMEKIEDAMKDMKDKMSGMGSSMRMGM